MGTEIQSKMYQPVYYTTPTLTTNVGHIGWSLLNENKSLPNGQQYDILSTRHECSKEQVRQMILKHDSIFKHQLTELHRLYERQKDLMNEIISKELLKIQNAAAASQLPPFSSGLPSIGSGHHRPSMSNIAISSQSYCNPILKIQPTSIFRSQAGVKKLQRRLFNLELPADQYISDEEEPEEELSAKEDYPHNRRNENKVSFVHPGGGFGDNNDASVSGLDKMSVSRDDVYRGVWPFAKKFPEKPLLGNNGGVNNMHLKIGSNQKEWLANVINADQTRTFGGSVGLLDFKKTNAASPLEARKACEPTKRTLFGIDISDRGLNSSYQASKSEVAAKFATNQLASNMPSFVGDFPYADNSHSSALKDFTQLGAQWHYLSIGSEADAKPSTNVHDKEFVNRLGNQDTLQGKPRWLEAASLCNGPLPLAADDNSAKVGIFKDVNICEAFEERIHKELLHSSQDGPIRVAAETLVAISSSKSREMQENAAPGLHQEISACREDSTTAIANSLMWFAEIASSSEQGQTNNVVEVNEASISACDEDSFVNSMDSFEYMTLSIVETELDEFYNATSDSPKE